MKKITKLILTLIAVLLLLSLTACGSSTKIDLTPYLSVSYTGYNGNGSAHVDFNFADFEYGIMSQWKGDDQFEKLGELTAVEMTITYTADTSEGLSNGDTVSVTVDFDEELAKEYGYAFTGLEKKFTVEGLTDPVMIDPFDESIFKITCEGISPFAAANMEYLGSRTAPEAYITYMADKQHDLANGDTVTVTATMSEKYTQQGYLLTRNEMEFTVEGLQSYITDVASLSSADVSALRSKATEYFNNKISEDWINLFIGENGYSVSKEDISSISTPQFTETGYAFLQNDWGVTSAVVIPFMTDIKDAAFHWWNNEYYESPLIQNFFGLHGYFIITDLQLDENSQLIKEGSFHIEMSCLYENEQQMMEQFTSSIDTENLYEGTFAD